MKWLVFLPLLMSNLSFATETTYPGTPANTSPAFILNRPPVYYPVINRKASNEKDKRNSQLPPQIMPRSTGE